jgi:hypothetical protein
MKEIKLSCESDGSKIEITYPRGEVDLYQQPIETTFFKVILYWLTFAPDTIEKMIPDCEECTKCDECDLIEKES